METLRGKRAWMHEETRLSCRALPLAHKYETQNTEPPCLFQLPNALTAVKGRRGQNGNGHGIATERTVGDESLNHAETIYQFLKERSKPVTNKEIATHLHIGKDRAIQGIGDEPGILERSREYIYAKYRVHLCTNFKGSMLIADPSAAEAYMAQVDSRARNSFKSLRAFRKRIEDARRMMVEEAQLKLNLQH